MAWLNSAAAILALRNLIHDGPTDKRAINKKVLGVMDGANTIFTTFENRRLTNLSDPEFPLGVYVNGAPLAGSAVVQDDQESGVFQLAQGSLPTNRQALTASYYYQWFNDSELAQFLGDAAAWLGIGTNYVNVTDGLMAALLRFAAQEAYEKAAMRYSTRMSEVFQLEDAPSEDILKSIEAFKEMADNFMDKASTMRDDFYKRQGASLAPNFGFGLGRIADPTPRR